MGVSLGAGGSKREVREIYVGVNGTPRKVIRGYVGVEGAPRRFYTWLKGPNLRVKLETGTPHCSVTVQADSPGPISWEYRLISGFLPEQGSSGTGYSPILLQIERTRSGKNQGVLTARIPETGKYQSGVESFDIEFEQL